MKPRDSKRRKASTQQTRTKAAAPFQVASQVPRKCRGNPRKSKRCIPRSTEEKRKKRKKKKGERKEMYEMYQACRTYVEYNYPCWPFMACQFRCLPCRLR